MSTLSVAALNKRYKSRIVVHDVSLAVGSGEVVGLLGPNGAGKTTCFNCVTGFLQPTAGSVRFLGADITRWAPFDIARLGLVRTFQIVHTFRDMTVLENVVTSSFVETRSAKDALATADRVIELTGLGPLRDKLAASLTIADKKRLEIARALATKPRLVMLDETMAGLNQTEIREAMDLCLRLKEDGMTLVVVEHIMEALMPISDRVVVLDSGRKIMEGTPEEVASDERVIRAYLGDTYNVAG